METKTKDSWLVMSITIVVPAITARLSYTFEWVFVQQLGVSYTLITENPEAPSNGLVIYYNNTRADFSIPNLGLLHQQGIAPQMIEAHLWDKLPTLFAAPQSACTLPFDFFSAVFYLLSRYEEYLPFQPDKHQRYPATESILFQHNLLHRPIVDEWLCAFEKLLNNKGITTKQRGFNFLPTYDIDIAWSYANKGVKRNLGGAIRDVLQGDIHALVDRIAVLTGHQKDPFDSYDFIEACHSGDAQRPIFFWLTALKSTAFDKNILPSEISMKELVQRFSANNITGIHPSYFTKEQTELLAQEKLSLESICSQVVRDSRQHYIRLIFPDTYYQLIGQGISNDYSMGYSTHLGFRAGTSRSFFWYDLQKEQSSLLRITPFCFMDATAHYELKLSASEAFGQLALLTESIQKVKGQLTTIFHNFSLGTDKEWLGWADAYQQFIQKLK